jgi:hypothetical protein
LQRAAKIVGENANQRSAVLVRRWYVTNRKEAA